MALDNIITRLQPANSSTLYDIGVFANRVFLGNNLDESNTLASMLNKYIATNSNGNICIDGYDDNNNGSIISKGSINTTDGGSNLQSLLFTDMTSRQQTFGIGGNKKSLIFGEGYGSVSNPNTAFGLNNSFIFGIDNDISCNRSGGNYPSMSSYLDNPLLSNCGVIGNNNRVACFSETPTSVAKNSLMVGYNNSLINDTHYSNLTLENSLIVGNNNKVENEGFVKSTLCFGKDNAITQSGVVLGEGLVQPNVENGVVVGAYNSRNALRDFMFEVGIGTSEKNRKTGFGIGKENDIYIYGPDGNYFVLKATSGRLTLTAYDNLGAQKASTNLIQW